MEGNLINTHPTTGSDNDHSDSPWDDPLPPESDKKADPQVVGSLEPTKSEIMPKEKPVPFNIPENVGDEKVGKKIPASEVLMPSSKPADVAPAPAINKPPPAATGPAILRPDKIDDIQPQEKSEFGAIDLEPANAPATLPEAPPKVGDEVAKQLDEQNIGEEKRKDQPDDLAEKKPLLGFFKKPWLLITGSVALLLIVGVYMTELGVLSIGFEKVYGLVGIEQLWGGLSRKPEKALALSAIKTNENLNFKIRGSVSLTVNKNIDSSITSPLVSYMINPKIAKDEDVSKSTKALLTVSEYDDYYDYYNSSTSDSTTETTESSTPVETEVDLGDQSEQAGYEVTESTIKELNIDFEGMSSNKAIKLDMELKKLVGADEQINLISSNEDLFVKSSGDIKFDAKAEANKWLGYVLGTTLSDNVFSDFLSIKTDSGFSVSGKRVSNDKIGKTRCYKYRIDGLEIGDGLSELGINKEVIQKISGDIWIAINDKTIRKVDLSIIPSISSSISRADIEFELYDFGIENSVAIPSLSEIVEIGSTQSTVSDTSSAPSVVPSNDSIRKADLQVIKTALNAYKKAHGAYPKASTLDKLNQNSSPTKTSLVTYLKEMPTDPKASDGWYYAYVSDGVTFTLSARIEDLTDTEKTKVGDIYLYYLKN